MSFYGSSVRFSAWDYVVLFIMLGFSALIGFYHSYKARRRTNSSSEEFMLGYKIGVFPITMSMVAGGVSGITVVTDCTETFYNGTQLQIGYVGFLFVAVCIVIFVLPVYWNLKITTVYQYLEMRFNTKISLINSAANIFHSVLYLGCAVYTPALALNQLTGASIWTSVLLMVSICTTYTLLGGLKAVVWTDTLQATVLATSVLVVFIYGTVNAGGVSTVWQRSLQTGRIDYFNLSTNFDVRSTLWGTTIYVFSCWLLSYSGNQTTVQKYLRVDSMKSAKRCILISACLDLLISIVAFFNGLVVYAAFYKCDPLKAGDITKSDQILPFYILNKLGQYPGLAGLLIAGIFSGALSVTSANLNAISVIVVEDYIKKIKTFKSMSEEKTILASRIAVLVIAILSILVVCLVERSSEILQINNSISGITCGPSLGVFIMALVFPFANWVGALTGMIVSYCVIIWISVDVLIFPPPIPSLPFGNCSKDDTNVVFYTNTTALPNWQGIELLYNVSYTWYPSIGTIICIVVGLLVSFATRKCIENKRNRKLYCPQVNWFMVYCKFWEPDTETEDQEVRTKEF